MQKFQDSWGEFGEEGGGLGRGLEMGTVLGMGRGCVERGNQEHWDGEGRRGWPSEKLLLGNDKEKGNESWEMVGMSLRMGTSWIEALRVLLEWWGLA